MDHTKLDEMNAIPVDAELDQELGQEEAQEESEQFTFKVDSRRDERVLAFYLVYAMDRFDYTIAFDVMVKNFHEGFEVPIVPNSFALTLAQGTIEARERLDEKLKPFLKNWKLERLGVCTKLILRLALWELEQSGAVNSIVINEAVELAKMFAEKDAYKFINGILDEMYQKSVETSEEEKESNE